MKEQIFYNVTYLDVIKEQIVPDACFFISDGKFRKIGKNDELSREQKEKAINLEGFFVSPGLFNIHVHALSTPIADPASLNFEAPAKIGLRGYAHLLELLGSGVTFVRDMNGRKQAEVELRDAIKEGILIGPHYQVCRQCLTMTGGHGSNTGFECDGEQECAKAARIQIKYGADFIKIIGTGGINSPGSEKNSELSEGEMRAAIDVAHKAGLKTAVHAHGSEGILNAVRAGIDSVEHGTYLNEDIVDLMLQKGTALVPTLSVSNVLLSGKVDISKVAKEKIEKSKRARDSHIRSFLMAWEAGVLIGLGNDAGTPLNPHTDTWREFKEMVDLGCDPFKVMKVGTIQSAMIAGVDDKLGSIEEGKEADFVLFKNNPLEDMTRMKDPHATYLGGKKFVKPDLI